MPGWQWQIKPVTFPSFLFLCCFVAKPPPAVLSIQCCCDTEGGEVYLHLSQFITPSSVSLFPPLFFHSITSLWFLIYVAMWPHSIDSFLIILEAEGAIALPSGSHRLRNGENMLLFFFYFIVIMSSLQKHKIAWAGFFSSLCFSFLSFCLFWFPDYFFFNFLHSLASSFEVFSQFRPNHSVCYVSDSSKTDHCRQGLQYLRELFSANSIIKQLTIKQEHKSCHSSVI